MNSIFIFPNIVLLKEKTFYLIPDLTRGLLPDIINTNLIDTNPKGKPS